MEFSTTEVWNETFWKAVEGVYVESFPYGRKSERIVRRLLDDGEGFLHAGILNNQVAAMALSAKLALWDALLIDYLGVSESLRSRGLGYEFVEQLKRWASEKGFGGIVIEVESTMTREAEDHPNERRIRFWENCGFQLTEPYLHDYRVVPELYRAMFLQFRPDSRLPTDGPTLFEAMGRYHKRAWTRQS